MCVCVEKNLPIFHDTVLGLVMTIRNNQSIYDIDQLGTRGKMAANCCLFLCWVIRRFVGKMSRQLFSQNNERLDDDDDDDKIEQIHFSRVEREREKREIIYL